MLNSRTISFSIARPVEVVYEFLLEPTNFAKWAFVGDVAMQYLSGRDWSVETSVGPRIIRFADRNAFGVLDHFTLRYKDDLPHPFGMRVVANGEGSELIYTYFQRRDVSDAEWTSTLEWIMADLLALKSLLESGEAR